MIFHPPCNGRSPDRRPEAARIALVPAFLWFPSLLFLLALATGPGGAAEAPPLGPPPGSGPFSLLPETAALPAAERSRLLAGEVLAHMEEHRGGGPREGVGIGVVEADPERVFRALADWGHWEEFMPYLERSDASPRPDGSVLVAQILDLPAPLGERRFTVKGRSRVDGTGGARVWRLDWASVPGAGNLDSHQGSWALVQLAPGRTLAVCRLRTDTGAPGWMADRATSKSLPWIFDGLRLQVRRSRYDAP